MSEAIGQSGRAFLFCAPHVPFLMIQEKAANRAFWDAYLTQAEALRQFDPEVVVVFGSDHYGAQHLRMLPSFAIGLAAEAIDDDGGVPGKLDVPAELALQCCETLIDQGFDIATSYQMEVDHGFSGVIYSLLGGLDARPVLPVFINCIAHPRPTMRRCRELGEAIGEFIARTGKRVAFVGSGGLSHDTGPMHPQFGSAPSGAVQEYLVHGGARGMSRDEWHSGMRGALDHVNEMLLSGANSGPDGGPGNVVCTWDKEFLNTLTEDDLTAFDAWSDASIVADAGNAAGEIRLWVAAAAAAKAAGVGEISLDFYEQHLPMGVAGVVVHA